jgi:cell division protein FtsB
LARRAESKGGDLWLEAAPPMGLLPSGQRKVPMNLVGKIFVVLIFVMSIFFMALVVGVYATHTNWKDEVMRPDTGLKAQLDAAQTRNQELKDQLTKLEEQVAAETTSKRETLAKLEQENDELSRERDRLEKELADLQKDQREAVAAMQATQNSLASLRKEVDELRTNIRNAQKERDEAFTTLVKTTDDLHQTANELAVLKQRNVQLGQQLADALAVLRKHGLEAIPARYEGVPPPVEGLVSAVTGSGMVEINIGSDDGLLKGHRLQVYRLGNGQSKYLGRIEVIQTEPDKAAAKILPEFEQGALQVGDRVASKIE